MVYSVDLSLRNEFVFDENTIWNYFSKVIHIYSQVMNRLFFIFA